MFLSGKFFSICLVLCGNPCFTAAFCHQSNGGEQVRLIVGV